MKFSTKVCALALVFLFGGLFAGFTTWQELTAAEPSDETGRCGTKVNFVDDEAEAFEIARKTGKLVYVLHLSGNLKSETFT